MPRACIRLIKHDDSFPGAVVLPIAEDVTLVHDPNPPSYENVGAKVYHLFGLFVDGVLRPCSGKTRLIMKIIDERDPQEGARLILGGRLSAVAWNPGGLFWFKAFQFRQASTYRIFVTLQGHPTFKTEGSGEGQWEAFELFVRVRDLEHEARQRRLAEADLAVFMTAADQGRSERESERDGREEAEQYPGLALGKREREWLSEHARGVGAEPPSHVLLSLSVAMVAALGTPGRKDIEVLRSEFLADPGAILKARIALERQTMLLRQGGPIARRLADESGEERPNGQSASVSPSAAGLSSAGGSAAAAAAHALLVRRWWAMRGYTDAPWQDAHGAGAGAGGARNEGARLMGPSLPFLRCESAARTTRRKPRVPLHLARAGRDYDAAWALVQRWTAAAREEYDFAMRNVRAFDALVAREARGVAGAGEERTALSCAKLRGLRSWQMVSPFSLRLNRHEPLPAGETLVLVSMREEGVRLRVSHMLTAAAWLKAAGVWAGERFAVLHAEWERKREKAATSKRATPLGPEPVLWSMAERLIAEGLTTVNRTHVPGIQAFRRYLAGGKPKPPPVYDEDMLKKKKARGLLPLGNKEALEAEEQLRKWARPVQRDLAYRVAVIPPHITRVVRAVVVEERGRPVPAPKKAKLGRGEKEWPTAHGSVAHRRLPPAEDAKLRHVGSDADDSGTVFELMWASGVRRPKGPITPALYPSESEERIEGSSLARIVSLAGGSLARPASGAGGAGGGARPAAAARPPRDLYRNLARAVWAHPEMRGYPVSGKALDVATDAFFTPLGGQGDAPPAGTRPVASETGIAARSTAAALAAAGPRLLV
jgi:hypothetical protein